MAGNTYAGTSITMNYNLVKVDIVGGKTNTFSSVLFDGDYVGYNGYRAYVKPVLDAVAKNVGMTVYSVAVDGNRILLYIEPPSKFSDYVFGFILGCLWE